MGPDDPFYQSVAAAPDDFALRLIYADYLDDHAHLPGAAARAGFIRLQCELDGLADSDPRRRVLEARASDLLWKNRSCWNGPLHRYLHRSGLRNLVASRRRLVRRWGYRRGFPETLFVQAAAFLEHADVLLRLGPIRELRLWSVRGLGPALAASPHLARLSVLGLRNCYPWNSHPTDDDLQALLRSPHLGPGLILDLSGNAPGLHGLQAAVEWRDAGRGTVLGLRAPLVPPRSGAARLTVVPPARPRAPAARPVRLHAERILDVLRRLFG
jgi:uncharacterized protein (TIGR02996 family)